MYRVMNLKKTYTIGSESITRFSCFLVYQHGDFASLSSVDIVGELFAGLQTAPGRWEHGERMMEAIVTACNQFVQKHKRLLEHAGQYRVAVTDVRQYRVSVVDGVSKELAEVIVTEFIAGSLVGLTTDGRIECTE